MDDDDYAFTLGKLHGNLRAIESVARLFLTRAENGPKAERVVDLGCVPVGGTVPASALADRRDLHALLRAYNALAPADLLVDPELIVSIRDALAQARAFDTGRTFPLRLLKFSEPSANGEVTVTHSQVLDEGWLIYQIHATFHMFTRMQAACQRTHH
jgi:hypothetical protein